MAAQVLASHSHEVFTDFDHYQEVYANVDSHSVQLDAGPLCIQHHELAFPDLILRRYRTNRSTIEHAFYPAG